jgi:hypothetical protein
MRGPMEQGLSPGDGNRSSFRNVIFKKSKIIYSIQKNYNLFLYMCLGILIKINLFTLLKRVSHGTRTRNLLITSEDVTDCTYNSLVCIRTEHNVFHTLFTLHKTIQTTKSYINYLPSLPLSCWLLITSNCKTEIMFILKFLTMVYFDLDCWVFRHCPLSGILKNTQRFENCIFFVLRCPEEGHL